MTCTPAQSEKRPVGRPPGGVNDPGSLKARRTAFGKYLTRARLAAKKTQKECAAEAGVSLTTWSCYENGSLLPELRTCHRVAPAVGLGFWEVAKQARPDDVKILEREGQKSG